MPVTPFHLAPGLLAKPVAPQRMSLAMFAAVQVMIDIEALVAMVRGTYPLHGPAHTLGGSLLVALAGVPLLLLPARWLNRWLAPRVPAPWRDAFGPVGWTAATVGAVLGALTHVLLDAVIHSDSQPFAPLADGNPLFVPGAFVPVHAICGGLVVVGLLICAWRLRRPLPDAADVLERGAAEPGRE